MSSHLNNVNILESVHSVLTNKVLDINNVFVLKAQQDSHFPQGTLKLWKHNKSDEKIRIILTFLFRIVFDPQNLILISLTLFFIWYQNVTWQYV